MTNFERCNSCVDTIKTQCDVYRSTVIGVVGVLAAATSSSVEKYPSAALEVTSGAVTSVDRMITSAATRIGQIGCEYDTKVIIQQLREA